MKPCLNIVSMDLLCNWDQKWTFFQELRNSYNHHVVICLLCLLSVPLSNQVPLLPGAGRLSSACQISVRLWFKYEFAEVRPGMVRAISCRHVTESKSPLLPWSFLSRYVESNIKQGGRQRQWKWSQSSGKLSYQSGQRIMEWEPVCWNCWELLRRWGRTASWMAVLLSCMWNKVGKRLLVTWSTSPFA